MDQRQRDAPRDALGDPALTADPDVGAKSLAGNGNHGSDDARAPEEGSALESAVMAPRFKKAAAERTGDIGRYAVEKNRGLGLASAD